MSMKCAKGHVMLLASTDGRTDGYKTGWRCDICDRSGIDARLYSTSISFALFFTIRFSSVSMFLDIGVILAPMMCVFLVLQIIDENNRQHLLHLQLLVLLLHQQRPRWSTKKPIRKQAFCCRSTLKSSFFDVIIFLIFRENIL